MGPEKLISGSVKKDHAIRDGYCASMGPEKLISGSRPPAQVQGVKAIEASMGPEKLISGSRPPAQVQGVKAIEASMGPEKLISGSIFAKFRIRFVIIRFNGAGEINLRK